MAARILSLSAMLGASLNAAAADTAAYTPPPAVTAGSLVQISFSLLMVLACIAAVAWLLKRMNVTQQGSGSLLKVIGSVAIGQRERVVLLEIENTWLLVGVGPGQIRTLHQMEKSEDWQSDATLPATADQKFSKMLSTLIRSRSSNAP